MDKEATDKWNPIRIIPLTKYILMASKLTWSEAQNVARHLDDVGYRKPHGKPPLLSDEALHEFGLWEDVPMLKQVAQAQWDICVKHYEG